MRWLIQNLGGGSLSAVVSVATTIALHPCGAQPVSLGLKPPVDHAANVVTIDNRSYRHCHIVVRRVYCHTTGALPTVWPPFSDRHPHRPTPKRETQR